ncbi:MAG: hypothetical protein ABIP29_02535 [Candidatus Eisenbacteria bacterium]
MQHLASLVLVSCALVAAGCGGGDRQADDGAPGAPFDSSASAAAATHDVPPDTSRAGPAFLAVYRDGPLGEVRVVRATDGALVVAGAADFPTGTRVTIALLRRTDGGGLEPVAMARAQVDAGHFMSAPLAPVGGPPPPGLQVLRLTVPFGPDDQEPAVLRAAVDGRRYTGSGMRTQAAGRIVFETTLEVPL